MNWFNLHLTIRFEVQIINKHGEIPLQKFNQLSIFLRSILFWINKILCKERKEKKLSKFNKISFEKRKIIIVLEKRELEKWKERKELDYSYVIKVWVECWEKKF